MAKAEILVTGAAGYIGAHTVVELAAAGYAPVMLDNLSRSSTQLLEGIREITGKVFPFYQVDCADKTELRKVFARHPGLTGVMHFAAYKSVNESVENPLLYYRNNLDSLLALLEAMNDSHVDRIVFSSSCTVYGQPDTIPVTEDAPFKKAESPYGASKQMSERILEDAVKSSEKLRAMSLRYFNPIGAHPSGLIGELPVGVPNNLVPYITQTAIGKRKKLTVFGSDYNTPDGSCLRDFIHVVDLAKAHVSAFAEIGNMLSRCEAFNLGTGIPCSVLELIKTFVRVTGVEVPFEIGPRRPGDIEKVYAGPRKSNRMLKWSTKLTIEDALRDAWNWEKQLSHATH